jgi:hypothetical protein
MNTPSATPTRVLVDGSVKQDSYQASGDRYLSYCANSLSAMSGLASATRRSKKLAGRLITTSSLKEA